MFHDAGGVHAGPDQPSVWAAPRQRSDPDHRSYRSFVSFSDPDGDGWLLQGHDADPRACRRDTTYASASDLSQALQRAAAAHGQHEARTGQPDPNWPDWYGEYMVREQAGEELPK